MLSIQNLAEGALAEQINDGLQKVIQNITDPNTAWKTKRKLNITLTFAPGEDRELADLAIEVKPTLAPAAPTTTRVLVGRNMDGSVAMSEFRKGVVGQVAMVVDDNEAAPATSIDTEEQELPAGLRVVGKSK